MSGAELHALLTKLFSVALCALFIAGCHAQPLSAKDDLKSPWWELGFTEPNYMKVWVEDTAVEDIKGKTFLRMGGGSASGGQPGDGTESARGWNRSGPSSFFSSLLPRSRGLIFIGRKLR